MAQVMIKKQKNWSVKLIFLRIRSEEEKSSAHIQVEEARLGLGEALALGAKSM